MERLTTKPQAELIKCIDCAGYSMCFDDECGHIDDAIEALRKYENTGLTPEQIQELKERDTAKEPEIHKNKSYDACICPNCNLLLIYRDKKGWLCGKHFKFCPDCGQRLKWEE